MEARETPLPQDLRLYPRPRAGQSPGVRRRASRAALTLGGSATRHDDLDHRITKERRLAAHRPQSLGRHAANPHLTSVRSGSPAMTAAWQAADHQLHLRRPLRRTLPAFMAV